MTAANVATYQVLVDWEQLPKVTLNDFEDATIGNWVAAASTIMEPSIDRSYEGTYSAILRRNITNTMKFDDATTPFDTGVFGSDIAPVPGLMATQTLTGLEDERVYIVSAWVYVPYQSYHVQLTCTSPLYDSTTTKYNKWIYLETSFTAIGTTEDIKLFSVDGPPAATSAPYIDFVVVAAKGDDITTRTLNLQEISFREGRDQARSLSAIAPSDVAFDVLNTGRRYSPNNNTSPLFSRSASGTALQIRALFEGRFYNLFNGFIDTFTINSIFTNYSTVSLTAFDQLGRMGSVNVSTELFNSIYVGDAINEVLDSVGWPTNKREIDVGATVIEWWWAEGVTALQAINDLVLSEGSPAFVFIDENENFVFRGRHHRYLRDNSIKVTASFKETEPPPFS